MGHGIIAVLLLAAASLSVAAEELDERLIKAVQWSDAQQVQALLAEGADPDSAGFQRSALGWAVQSESLEILRLLLDAGADPNRADDYGNSALAWAVELENVAMVAPLVAGGADVDARTAAGRSLVMVAVGADNTALLEALAAAGANLDVTNSDGATPALMAVQGFAADPAATLKVLAEGGANLDLGDGYYTPLTFAAEQGDEAAVAALLDGGADPNAGVNDSYPLIKGAASPEIVGRLLLAGANPNVSNAWGESALFSVIDYGTPQLVQAMIDAGADFKSPSDQGQTPLDRARTQGLEAIEQVLLAAGAGEEQTAAAQPDAKPGVGPLAGLPSGELAELPKLGMVTVMGGVGGSVTYFSSSTVPALSAFYAELLNSRGWAAGEQTTDDVTYLSGSYARGDETLTLSLSQDSSADEPRVMVSLTPHGSAKPADLPRVAGATVIYEGPATAIYLSEMSVAEVGPQTLVLLQQAGWSGAASVDNETLKVLTLEQAGVRLTAQISQAPAQGNKTTIQYSLLKTQ